MSRKRKSHRNDQNPPSGSGQESAVAVAEAPTMPVSPSPDPDRGPVERFCKILCDWCRANRAYPTSAVVSELLWDDLAPAMGWKRRKINQIAGVDVYLCDLPGRVATFSR